ncbi:unnamed protein product [Ranitomeya imitator]|uniref:1-alkyl-2-acetylglycerophosphocholine esterase n=1 Tax=Ranitomeya imitator TaxID=111125 RepID=A0ABN9M9M3_9NEOB|nr:unnamed protein product [Ranitomeya imitator]
MADKITPSLRITAGSGTPGESGTKLLDRASAFTFLDPGRNQINSTITIPMRRSLAVSASRTVTAGRKVKAEHSGCAFTFTLRPAVTECGKQTARDLTDTRILTLVTRVNIGLRKEKEKGKEKIIAIYLHTHGLQGDGNQEQHSVDKERRVGERVYDRKPKVAKTINNWLQAFAVLGCVMGEKHPERCSELFIYMDSIYSSYKSHGGSAWWKYDEDFRRRLAVNPHLGKPQLSKNLKSARELPAILHDKLNKEIRAGRFQGPFDSPPFFNLRVSPLGIVPKKESDAVWSAAVGTAANAGMPTFGLGCPGELIPKVFHRSCHMESIRVSGSVCDSTYEATLISAAFSLAFFGAMRVSEILPSSRCRAGGLQLEDLVICDDGLRHGVRSYAQEVVRFGLTGMDVIWRGTRGLTWSQVLLEIVQIARVASSPTVVVIHAGGNDLASFPLAELLTLMRADLDKLPGFFPVMRLVWSEMIPRLVWRGARELGAMERSRRTLNQRISRFIRFKNGVVVRHHRLEGDNSGFLLPDGVHLNDAGLDIFLDGLREGVVQAHHSLGGS